MSYSRESIARMEGYVPGEQPKDRRYIKLNTNENPYPPSPRVAEALRSVDPSRLRLYPDPLADALRDVAAARYGYTRDWVICGNGSDDLLTMAVRTFVDQGGALAFPTPSYSLYPVLAGLQGARGVSVPLGDGFSLPNDAAEQATGCSLFLLARPNAPTGNAFPLDAVHRLCQRFAGVIWIDEAYADFAPDSCMDFARRYPNVVVSRTVSKSYSLAGLRLGLAWARPGLVTEMMKVKDSYNVSLLTQLLGRAALEDHDYMASTAARVCQTRGRVSEALVALGFEVLPSAANFIFVKPPVPAPQYMQALRDRGILIRYFAGPRTGAYVRITIGTDAEMDALLTASAQVLGRS